MTTSVFQMFKIIAGLLMSVFIIYFAVSYSGTYTQVQSGISGNQELRDFVETSRNVYLTGNPSNFKFTKKPTFNYESGSLGSIVYGQATAYPKNPILFSAGERIFIDSNSLGLGWTDYKFTEAMPETHVILNPLDTSPQTMQLLQDTTLLMPSTAYFKPDVVFGFCDSGSIAYNFCNGWCERDDFSFYLLTPGLSFGECTAAMPPGYMLLTAAEDCTGKAGVCIGPPDSNGMGLAFADGRQMLYKDPLDIAALVIGGAEAYDYKNSDFAETIAFESAAEAARARLLEARLKGLLASGSLDPRSNPGKCAQAYSNFAASLDAVGQGLEKGYHTDPAKAVAAANALKQAKLAFGSLKSLGCE